MENKLKLYGFNNLTKALSFNIYDVCYAKTEREQLDYIKYIDQQYNSERLTGIMEKLTEMIGAHVLHISKQDYDPQGASVTFLIAEEHMKPALEPDTIVAHLDKSHVTVHTYPEYHPDTCLATFRVDIDVARRCPPSTTSSARSIRTLSRWTTACADLRAILRGKSCSWTTI